MLVEEVVAQVKDLVPLKQEGEQVALLDQQLHQEQPIVEVEAAVAELSVKHHQQMVEQVVQV
jgi:hypothetical protein